jgi:Holliday junction resolvasome RuvABC endonuclease subunit
VIILALDLATVTGFARSDGISGTFDLSIRKDESGSFRLIRLRSKLKTLCDPTPNLLVFESAIAAAKHTNGIGFSFELQGVVKLFCEDHDIEYRGYAPSEVKVHATGKGNANKDAVLAAARERWPQVKDHNEADALFLLSLAQRDYE